MTNLTRRGFGQLIAGLVSLRVSTASFVVSLNGSTASFVKHKILRRPYGVDMQANANPGLLYDCLWMRVECTSALRIVAKYPGMDESVLEATVHPRSGEMFKMLGVHSHRAEMPLKITISSRQPFKVRMLDAIFLRPPFRVEDGMMIFHDKFYPPKPITGFIGSYDPIQRVIGGPGKDVGYS